MVDRAIANEGVLSVMSRELSEPISDAIELRRPLGWMSGFFGALVADVKVVDSGSLDVLVYCGDDLSARAPRDWRLAGGVDAP